MQNIGRFFRNAITITPSFMIANLIRGDMAGVVTETDAPIRPMVDTIRGLNNALTRHRDRSRDENHRWLRWLHVWREQH